MYISIDSPGAFGSRDWHRPSPRSPILGDSFLSPSRQSYIAPREPFYVTEYMRAYSDPARKAAGFVSPWLKLTMDATRLLEEDAEMHGEDDVLSKEDVRVLEDTVQSLEQQLSGMKKKLNRSASSSPRKQYMLDDIEKVEKLLLNPR